jgi:hypothetical protein
VQTLFQRARQRGKVFASFFKKKAFLSLRESGRHPARIKRALIESMARFVCIADKEKKALLFEKRSKNFYLLMSMRDS